MVLAVLAALMVLAVPFLSIARHENAASVSPYARAEAKSQVEGLLRLARYRLSQGHRASEEVRAAMGASTLNTPLSDTPEEFDIELDLVNGSGEPLRDGTGVAYQYPRNPRGLTADLRIRDEQSFPNLLSSSPFLIAASLGRSVLVADITPEDTEITVENGDGFPSENGTLLIEGEVITYSKREGGTFSGCQRGSGDGLRAAPHRAEVYVLDDRARQIAMLPYRSPRAGGGYREPGSLTYIKELSLVGEDPLSPLEVDRFDREFTVYGARYAAGRFGGKVSVLTDLLPENYDGDGFPISVRSTDAFAPGTIVRISDGYSAEYGMVARRRSGGRSTIWLHAPIQRSYSRATASVEPLLPHPVCINSASREVLYRLIEGIQLGQNGRADGSNGRVDEDAAAVLVEGILEKRPIQDLQHFRQVLAELADSAKLFLTELQAAAVFRNAINPADPALVYSTVPFSFASSDHYTVEATAVVNDGSGQELARASVRERIYVAPQGVLELFMGSQAAFDEPFYRAREGRWTVTHPFPVERWESPNSVPASRVPRFLWRFGSLGSFLADRSSRGQSDDVSFQDGVFGHRTEGDVRLLPARTGGRGYMQHFDGPGYLVPDSGLDVEDLGPEGFLLSRGPFEFSPADPVGSIGGGGGGRGGRGRGGGQGNGSLGGRVNPNPVRLDTWFRTGRAGGTGRQVIFDYAVPGATNEGRIQLLLDGAGTLVGRVDDRTIDSPGDALTEVAEVRWTPESGPGFWRPNTWYHLGISYRGSKPDDLALWVDGYKRGESKFATRLQGGLARTGTFFSVENADDWPIRGVCQVGSEVIAYERSGTSFDVVAFGNQATWGRGQRGTRALDHSTGAPVRLFGYSILPRGPDQGAARAIPAGQVTLSDTLGPMTPATFAENATIQVSIPVAGGLSVPLRINVHDPSAPGGNTMTLLSDARGTLDFDCFPASGGYVLIVSRSVSVAGSSVNGLPVGSVELARYESRSGNQLQGLTAVTNPANPGLVTWANSGGVPADPGQLNGLPEFFLNRQIHPVRVLPAGSGPNSIPGVDFLSCVIPISVHVSNPDGVQTPENVNDPGGSNTGINRWDTEPEFVEVGLYDLDNLTNHDVEWIRYHHKDERGNLLCDEVRFLALVSTYMRTVHLGQPQGIFGSDQFVDLALPLRRQCGTDQLSDGRPSAGSRLVPCIRTVTYGSTRNVTSAQGGTPMNGARWSSAGWGDEVTIEGTSGRDRVNATVSWAALDQIQTSYGVAPNQISIPISRQGAEQGFISLTDNLNQEYRQRALPGNGEAQTRDRYVRILKFPSGELPEMRGARAFIGGSIDGEVASEDSIVDEVRITPFEPERYILWDHSGMGLASQTPSGRTGIDANTDEIPIANVRWVVSPPVNFGANPRFYILADGRKIHIDEGLRGLPQNDAGIVRIGEELIAFRRIGNGASGAPALLGCERGILGTMATPHGFGADVAYLDFKDASMLANAADATTESFDLTRARVFPASEGTVLINSELIHYTQIQGNRLLMPLRVTEAGESQGGLFRGRFGTGAQAHSAESLVYDMPFRYWDRYVPGQDSAELAYYGFSLDLQSAFYHTLALEVERPQDSLAAEVVVRLDSQTPWTAPIGSPGLFHFPLERVGEEILPINQSGDGLSVRVHFTYQTGAFDPVTMESHGWKSSPILKSVRLRYLDQTRVLEREVLK
jgi:hypothetical protein